MEMPPEKQMNARILIADDDDDLVEGLRWYLEAEGYDILTASDGEKAVEATIKERPDLIILDVMMPRMDGVKACRKIREETDAMILMLSARDNEIDKVRTLKLGADDYVTKPFHTSELLARIQALLRRRNRAHTDTTILKWRNLSVYPDEHRAYVDGKIVELTTMEFELLVALMKSPQVVMNRDKLVEVIWGADFYGEYRLVDNHIYRLRDKLSKAGCADFPISTVRGVGYAFRPEV